MQHTLHRVWEANKYGHGHPLRKDFPLTGYLEVRYGDYEKRVKTAAIAMSQESWCFILRLPGKH